MSVACPTKHRSKWKAQVDREEDGRRLLQQVADNWEEIATTFDDEQVSE